MTFTTASQARDRAQAILTTEQLIAKYSYLQTLIDDAAAKRQYSLNISTNSLDSAEFTSWISSYGYQVWPNTVEGIPISDLTVGTQINLTVTWSRVTVTPSTTTVSEGGNVNWLVATQGYDAGATLYWTQTGSATLSDFNDALQMQGTLTLNSQGQDTIQRQVAVDLILDPNETVIISIYRDSARTQLVATAATVTIA